MIKNFDSINNILIPYDCIVDEDSGLLRVIREFYSNDTVFFMDKIDSDQKIEELILNEKYENPLDLILQPDYKDKADDFYLQFYEEEYDNILDLSFMTLLYKFVLLVRSNKLSRITFLANDEAEKDSLEILFGKDTDIVLGYIDEINLDDIDTIFIRRVSDIENFENIRGKNLYVLNYNFNFETSRDDENPLPI